MLLGQRAWVSVEKGGGYQAENLRERERGKPLIRPDRKFAKGLKLTLALTRAFLMAD